jgi:stage II sporulation protein D
MRRPSYAGTRTALKVGLGESNGWELVCPGNLAVSLEDDPGRRISVREGAALRASLVDPKPAEPGVCPVLEISANVDSIDPKTVAAAFARDSEQPRVDVSGVRVADDANGADAAIDLRQARLVLGPCRSADEVEQICRRLIDSNKVACTAGAGIKTPPGGTLVLTTSQGLEISRFRGPARVRCEGADTIYVEKPEWKGKRRAYRDWIVLTPGPGGQVLAINEVGLENYVKGVVPAEIFPDAPDQALEAQAVVARTDALAKLGSRHVGQGFDLCDDVHCQAYRGRHRRHRRHRGRGRRDAGAGAAAQRRARGRRVPRRLRRHHRGQRGGVAEAAGEPGAARARRSRRRPRDAPRLPPSRRICGATCSRHRTRSACAPARPGQHRWTRAFTAEELGRLVSAEAAKLGKIKALRADGRGASGRVTALTIEGTTGTRRIEGELAIRKALGDLPSSAFAIQTIGMSAGEPGVFVLVGAGNGHGVGMCQTGAIGMAQAKLSMADILGRYYQGARAYRLAP